MKKDGTTSIKLEIYVYMFFIFFLPTIIAIHQISFVLELDRKVNSNDILKKECKYSYRRRTLKCDVNYSFNYKNKQYTCTKTASYWFWKYTHEYSERPYFGMKPIYFSSKDPNICKVEFWSEDDIKEYICIIVPIIAFISLIIKA